MPASDIAEERLANGLRVCVAENRTVQAVTVNLWYGVGSRHEQAGRTGLAHLFEHLMFQGSANVASGEHMTLLESFGADLNATTSFDRTNYFQTVPTRAFELALWLEADRMGGLLAALDQGNLDNQRDVVRNERRERYDNQPYGDVYERMHAMLFPPGHPYHHLPIGSMADLQAASLDDVRGFFEQHYAPSNAVLTIAGDVDTREAFGLAAQHFGHIAPGTGRPQPAEAPPLGPLNQPVLAEASGPVPAEGLICGWRLPPDGTDEYEAASIALRILGGGASSRLQETLTRQSQLAQGVFAAPQDLTDQTAAGLVMVHVNDGVPVADVESALLAELQQFIETGPTEAELDRALAQAEREWLESTAMLDGLADEISRAACLFGTTDRVGQTLERLRSVTTDRVHAVARTWLNPHQRVQLIYRKEQS